MWYLGRHPHIVAQCYYRPIQTHQHYQMAQSFCMYLSLQRQCFYTKSLYPPWKPILYIQGQLADLNTSANV